MTTSVQHPGDTVLIERRGAVGLITLNRPQALNALSLDMVRAIVNALLHWREDEGVALVLMQGASRAGRPPAFCAGGDIRFLHQASLAGDPRLEDFFTEEYQLNHLIHHYPKCCVVFMDGVVMGGGMGLAQGACLRVVTEHSQVAMPETLIGLFPDVGGGYFLSRCPGRVGEYLALTGQVLGPGDAMDAGLADLAVPASALPRLVLEFDRLSVCSAQSVRAVLEATALEPASRLLMQHREAIDCHFSKSTLLEIVHSLEADSSPWAQEAAAKLRSCSPLMLAVTLEQVRRARHLTLEDDLRMERTLVRHSFNAREGMQAQPIEGIRALAIDKDRKPAWSPARIEDVTMEMVMPFFESPWPPHAHPLRHFLV